MKEANSGYETSYKMINVVQHNNVVTKNSPFSDYYHALFLYVGALQLSGTLLDAEKGSLFL
jgi:hypothetical protein